MKIFVLLMIRFYQRFLSPIKGYSCAYRVYTGQDSCSAYGYKVIDRYGAFIGYRLIQRRIRKCSEVIQQQNDRRGTKRYQPRYQSGDCDPGCDSFDLPSCDSSDLSDLCTLPCDSCDLDFSNDKKKDQKPMKYQPLPEKI
ncbi:membrane protein insertion efficiency factor YidD [Aquirhabdus parva]|uniref:Membrane protein insertion efficiency factor YidD n=1 Tax=Aquirhabdus parva TaxID=2283318 RepID=A0A345PA41_9GAMM|nr:membrane protein insertion efficiency factor YidD [Aquirhabdus parva]AXI04150.1 membrane protein insertion efficiency factor YidD [Aquirhabdus parva]